MNKLIAALFCPPVFIVALMFVSGALPISRVTIRVLDENSSPVPGAQVRATFQSATLDPKNWGTGRDRKIQDATTDQAGAATLEGYSDGELGGGVRKDGYYRGWWDPYQFSGNSDKRWQPWNPTIGVVLKKIGVPIAMYARKIEAKFPVEAWPAGFDLAESDWVAPYGRGKISDLVFEVNRAVRSPRDFNAVLKLTFSNAGDGIFAVPIESQNMSSELRLPHQAPETGYSPEHVWQMDSSNGMSYEERQKGSYFYRVRTVFATGGHIGSALYGKIHGDLKVYVGTQAPKPGIGFTYYLNPTPNDRNLEFDPKRNLFANLKPEERVTAP